MSTPARTTTLALAVAASSLMDAWWCARKGVPWRSWNPLKRTQPHCVGGSRSEGRRMSKHTGATALVMASLLPPATPVTTADPTTTIADDGSAHADAVCSKLAENPSFDGIVAAQMPTIGDSITFEASSGLGQPSAAGSAET